MRRLYEKSIEKSIGLLILYIKASSNFACGMKSRWNYKKCTNLMNKIVATLPFSTSVLYVMEKSSLEFHLIGTSYKTKKF